MSSSLTDGDDLGPCGSSAPGNGIVAC